MIPFIYPPFQQILRQTLAPRQTPRVASDSITFELSVPAWLDKQNVFAGGADTFTGNVIVGGTANITGDLTINNTTLIAANGDVIAGGILNGRALNINAGALTVNGAGNLVVNGLVTANQGLFVSASALKDTNNSAGSAGQFLSSTGSRVVWGSPSFTLSAGSTTTTSASFSFTNSGNVTGTMTGSAITLNGPAATVPGGAGTQLQYRAGSSSFGGIAGSGADSLGNVSMTTLSLNSGAAEFALTATSTNGSATSLKFLNGSHYVLLGVLATGSAILQHEPTTQFLISMGGSDSPTGIGRAAVLTAENPWSSSTIQLGHASFAPGANLLQMTNTATAPLIAQMLSTNATVENYINITDGTNNGYFGRDPAGVGLSTAGQTYVYGDDTLGVGIYASDAAGVVGLYAGGASVPQVKVDAAGALNVGVASSVVGKIVLRNATNANTTTIKSGIASSSITITLPTALPTGSQIYAIGSDSAGVESFLTFTGSGVSYGSGTYTFSGGGGGSGTITLAGTLAVANGGSGTTTLTNHGVLLGSGTAHFGSTTAGATGQVLLGGGASADPAWGAASVTLSSGTTTLGSSSLTFAAGSNITLTLAGTAGNDTLTIASTGGGGSTSPGGAAGQLQAHSLANDTFAGIPGTAYDGSGNVTLGTLYTGGLPFGGAEIAIVNAATTLTIGREHSIKATSANQTNGLPSPTGNAGKVVAFRITNDTTKLVTIDAGTGVTIDGSQTRILWAGESAQLLCDGSNWFKVGGRTIPMMGRGNRTSLVGGIASTTTTTKIPLSNVKLDNTGLMVDTTNGQIVIQRGGVYALSGLINYAASDGASAMGAANNVQCRIQDGVTTVSAQSIAYSSPWFPAIGCQIVIACSAADSITLNAYQTSSASVDIYTAVIGDITWLSAIEIPQW